MKKILSTILAFTIACTSYVGVGAYESNTSIVYATSDSDSDSDSNGSGDITTEKKITQLQASDITYSIVSSAGNGSNYSLTEQTSPSNESDVAYVVDYANPSDADVFYLDVENSGITGGSFGSWFPLQINFNSELSLNDGESIYFTVDDATKSGSSATWYQWDTSTETSWLKFRNNETGGKDHWYTFAIMEDTVTDGSTISNSNLTDYKVIETSLLYPGASNDTSLLGNNLILGDMSDSTLSSEWTYYDKEATSNAAAAYFDDVAKITLSKNLNVGGVLDLTSATYIKEFDLNDKTLTFSDGDSIKLPAGCELSNTDTDNEAFVNAEVTGDEDSGWVIAYVSPNLTDENIKVLIASSSLFDNNKDIDFTKLTTSLEDVTAENKNILKSTIIKELVADLSDENTTDAQKSAITTYITNNYSSAIETHLESLISTTPDELPTPTITITNESAKVGGTISVSASYGDDNTAITDFTWIIDGNEQSKSSYTIATTDAGKTLTVKVTIVDTENYNAKEVTKEFEIADLDKLSPTITSDTENKEEGYVDVGDTLTVSVDGVTSDSDYEIKWYYGDSATAANTNIDSATDTSFTIPNDGTYDGKYITASVTYTGTDGAYSTDEQKSKDVVFVYDGRIEIPTINFDSDDVINVGDELKASVTGSDYQWFTVEKSPEASPMSINYTYTAIDGATSSTYTITNTDFGKQIAVAIAPIDKEVDFTDLSKLKDRYDFSMSALTQSVGKEKLLITLSYEQDKNDDTKGTITAKYNNGGDFGTNSDAGELESNYTFVWKKGDEVISDTNSSTYEYTAIGTYTVTVTAEDDAKYTTTTTDGDTTSHTVSDSINVVIKTALPTPVIKDEDENGKETTAKSGDILYVYSTDYEGIDFINFTDLTFKWYAKSTTSGVKDTLLQTHSPTGTTSTYFIEDEHSGKEIYVVAEPKTTAENYKESEPSATVEIDIVYYDVKLDFDTLLPNGDALKGTDVIAYGNDYTVTLSVSPEYTDTHSLPAKSDLVITMGGATVTSFDYSNGKITISSVNGDIVIKATAVTDTPDAGTNVPQIVLDKDTMLGVTSSRTTLKNDDLNSDGWYEFTLSAETLPNSITIKFTASVTMTIADGYSYDSSTGVVSIDPAKFSSALGYYATITGTWDSGTDTGTSEYTVNYSASGTGITSNSGSSSTVTSGYPLYITLNTDNDYSSPIVVESITMTMTDSSDNTTTLSTANYSTSGTTLTIKAGAITDDCTLVIVANATKDGATTHKVSLYLGSYIDIDDGVVNYVVDGETYTLTLIPADGYNLPSEITVTMGSNTLATSAYSYNSTTGVISIPKVDNDVTITVGNATAGTYYTVTHNLKNASYVSGHSAGSYEEGTTYIATFASDEGYYDLVKSNITISPNNYETFSYDLSGQVTITGLKGDIEIKIEADERTLTQELWFSLNGLYNNTLNNDEHGDDKVDTIVVNTGEDYNVTLYAKDGYELKTTTDDVRIEYKRTDNIYDDYTTTLNTKSLTIAMKSIDEPLNIYAYANKVSTDDDDDDSSGGGSDDDSSSSSNYSITFVDASGNTVTTLTTGTDKTLSYLPTLSVADGYVFAGWYTSGGTKITTSTVFSANRTIYAKVIAISTPTYDGGTNYYISTSSSDIAIYANQLLGGTITITGTNYVNNLIIVPPYSNYSISNATNIVMPDSNGNTAMWTIPAGATIDDDNYPNLGIIVSENAIHTSTTLGRSLGYVDFTHSGNLFKNGTGVNFTFRNYNASTGDTLQFYKLNDYDEFAGNYNSASAIGNSYVRVTMYSCSRWVLIARNYTYNPGTGGNDGYYTQYYNIPTTGYIAELRNVTIGQVLDLTAINVGNGQIIEGWYYDQLFTNKVSNPSYVVVTEAIVQSGLYPKYVSDYVTPETGNPWPDAGNNYNPDLSGNPSTNTNNLPNLF